VSAPTAERTWTPARLATAGAKKKSCPVLSTPNSPKRPSTAPTNTRSVLIVQDGGKEIKMQFLQNIRTAANVFGAVRKARKAGADAVQIRAVYSVPVYVPKPAFLNTIEGCQAWNSGRDVYKAVLEVFKSLPYETQRRLEFTPKGPGEWVERAQFWQQQLKPALPPEMYCDVMILFIHWYAHCLRMKREVRLYD